MVQYIIKRLLLMLVTLFGITVITFIVTRLTPGEPAGVAMDAAPGGAVSYDDLIEQNRRNLGLDKPMLVNLRFEDREYVARQALRDFIRPVSFWREDARRRLRLSSTIALEPALELIENLQHVEGNVTHEFEPTADPRRMINPEDSTRRLLELMPNLAQVTPPELENLATIEEKIVFWREWYRENIGRFETSAVRQAVSSYLSGEGELGNVLIRGGYAVPYLIEALDTEDAQTALRANRALSGLTGFSYLSAESLWEQEREEVTRRWESFWNREKTRFQEYTFFGDAFNIIANTQFGVWMGQILRFDFGSSYKYNRSVNQLIIERLPVTLVISGLSIFFSYLIAIPIGIFSAVKKNHKSDKLLTVLLFVLYSLPSFWVAQMLLMTLTGGPTPWGGEWPEWFPTRGMNSPGFDWQSGNPSALVNFGWHLVLPVLCLTYGSLAFLSRQMRSAMLETMSQDFVRTAHAKGLSARAVIFKHTLRNSLIPILTISAGLLPELIGGSVIVESIFSIPGMGLLSFESILNRDYPLVNAILFFSALLTLLGILVADLSYAFVDPRISYD